MKNNMKTIFTLIIIFLFIFIVYKVSKPMNDRYNAHVCAVNGYMPDCKTKLK